jgi:hypothetical protein
MQDRFILRLVLLGLVVFLLVAAWRLLPGMGLHLGGDASGDAAPRTVVARGDLAGDEQATIQLFERSRDSVVFISTRQQVQDFWTRNVF